jgi:hypothetical protein
MNECTHIGLDVHEDTIAVAVLRVGLHRRSAASCATGSRGWSLRWSPTRRYQVDSTFCESA